MCDKLNLKDCTRNEWIKRVKHSLIEKTLRCSIPLAEQEDFIPYSTEGGRWKRVKLGAWTNGFWAAYMWQLFRMTDDVRFRNAAVRAEEIMDTALQNFEKLHHDVGFMWLIMSGVRYALEHNDESRRRCMLCADLLAGRYNPNGFIRAWNEWDNEAHTGWAIIDCMMNLPLLYWASRQTNDPRFRLIAMHHADTALKHFVREDGSCNHIVIFDPENGEVIDKPAGQGYAPGSSWSRGQAWAIYGFTLSYMMTGKAEYLEAARRVAGYFISEVRKTGMIPLCDFRQPETPVLWDDSASMIAACGLLRLASVTGAELYSEAAFEMLRATVERDADFSSGCPAVLQRCTGAYHSEDTHHITMNYADYYLAEALSILEGDKYIFWAPDIETGVIQ